MINITHSSLSSNLLWTAIWSSKKIHSTIWPQHSPSQIRKYEGKIQTYAHTNISPFATHSLWGAQKLNSTQIQVCVCVSMWLKLLQENICTLCCVYVGILWVDKSGHPRCTSDESWSNTCVHQHHTTETHQPGRTQHNRCAVLTPNKPIHFGWMHQQHLSPIVD